MHGNPGHMLVKLLFAQLYHLRQRKQHLNSRLLLLSTFLPHNLNLHQLPGKRQQRVPLFWRRCFKRAPRSPYWRTKWCKFQNATMEQWNKVHEQLTGDAKERHEREKPMPVKSVLRSTDVRWAALYLAYMYWKGSFVPFKQFLLDMVKALDDAPETVGKLLALLTDNNVKVIKTQLAFVAHYMQTIYDLIASFQKQTEGLANPLKCLDDIKTSWGCSWW